MVRQLTGFDKVTWLLYDTIELTRDVLTKERYTLYNGGWERYDRCHNMEMANMLSAPCSLELNAMNLVSTRSRNRRIYETIAQFFDNYRIEVWLGQKIYYKSLLNFFPLNADWDQIFDKETDTWRQPSDVIFDPILEIPMYMHFKVDINGTPIKPSSDAKVSVGLKGKLTRGVQ